MKDYQVLLVFGSQIILAAVFYLSGSFTGQKDQLIKLEKRVEVIESKLDSMARDIQQLQADLRSLNNNLTQFLMQERAKGTEPVDSRDAD